MVKIAGWELPKCLKTEEIVWKPGISWTLDRLTRTDWHTIQNSNTPIIYSGSGPPHVLREKRQSGEFHGDVWHIDASTAVLYVSSDGAPLVSDALAIVQVCVGSECWREVWKLIDDASRMWYSHTAKMNYHGAHIMVHTSWCIHHGAVHTPWCIYHGSCMHYGIHIIVHASWCMHHGRCIHHGIGVYTSWRIYHSAHTVMHTPWAHGAKIMVDAYIMVLSTWCLRGEYINTTLIIVVTL